LNAISRLTSASWTHAADGRRARRTPGSVRGASACSRLHRCAKTPRLERLIRKFDPSERDFRNRALGKAGEALIIDFERRRLAEVERRDLAGKVRWVSQEDGDGAATTSSRSTAPAANA